MDEPDLRQIRVVNGNNEVQIKNAVKDVYNARDVSSFIPGPCQHNKKFACVFFPCVVPLFYIGGELLFGSAVFCLLIVYLVDNTSRSRRSSLVAYVLSVLIFQLTSIYCLVPFLWKSVFNLGLLFIYNVFIVLSGGVGLLQTKQLQHEEPEFVMNMEYVLYVSYPIVGELTLAAVAGNMFSWPVAPFFCIIFGFLFLQVFYPPSKSSFSNQSIVHRAGQERPPERFILTSLEKTLLLFNLVTVPGSMFIVINFWDFFQFMTLIRLLLCGILPVFLCTCLDIREEMDFLEFSKENVAKVKLGSGVGSVILLCMILVWSGSVAPHVLPVMIGNVVCGVFIWVTSGIERWKVYQNASYLGLVILSLVGLFMLPWSLSYHFQFLSLPLWIVNALIGLVSCLSVICVFVSSGTGREWLNPLLVIHSVGFVLCEHVLVGEKLYPVYFSVGTMLLAFYVCERLQHAGRLHSQSVSLCIAVHGSKIPLCLSTILPYQPTAAVLLPSFLLMSPALLVFLFTFAVCKLIEAQRNLSRNEALKLCIAAGVATVATYDVLVLPLWFMMTHAIPSSADIAAAVVFIWGALCLKLSYQHFSHIMAAKRINVLVLCSSVLVEIIQPDFNIYRVLQAMTVYLVSLFYPLFATEQVLLSESVVLPWFILISLITLIAVLTKVINLELCSWYQRVALAVLIGFSPGLQAFVMMAPLTRPPLFFLLFGISSSVTLHLLMVSWKPIFGEEPAKLSLPYLLLLSCLVASLGLESLFFTNLSSHKESTRSSPESPSLLYHLCLHLALGLGMKRHSVAQKESLEQKKGKLPSGLFLQSCSFLSNASLLISFLLALLSSPSDLWELWMSCAVLLLLFLRPEGTPYLRGVRIQYKPTLPAAVALALCMYPRTVTEALPSTATWLWTLVYVLEMIILLGSLPTFVILMRALWCSGEISLVEQQLVMFTAPSNVALLIYSSTLSGRILGLVGIFAVYWLFYDVKVTVDK